jgi:hypothetical protein
MNRSSNIQHLQGLLYVWLSQYDSRSLAVIKNSCDSLNESYGLELPNPIWSLFWPLVFNGQVDHVGNGYYALTEPLIIDYESYRFSINVKPSGYKGTPITGIYISKGKTSSEQIRSIKADALSVLKQIPSFEEIVDKFPKTLQDESNLEYYNYKTKRGIAKIEKDGLTRYFSLPEKLYIKELPAREINPEAFAIAYCLSRNVNDEYNGKYNSKTQELFLPTFALPITIYRTLMLETMKSGLLPEVHGPNYLFRFVAQKTVQELNRIFSNSIRYE